MDRHFALLAIDDHILGNLLIGEVDVHLLQNYQGILGFAVIGGGSLFQGSATCGKNEDDNCNTENLFRGLLSPES